MNLQMYTLLTLPVQLVHATRLRGVHAAQYFFPIWVLFSFSMFFVVCVYLSIRYPWMMFLNPIRILVPLIFLFLTQFIVYPKAIFSRHRFNLSSLKYRNLKKRLFFIYFFSWEKPSYVVIVSHYIFKTIYVVRVVGDIIHFKMKKQYQMLLLPQL